MSKWCIFLWAWVISKTACPPLLVSILLLLQRGLALTCEDCATSSPFVHEQSGFDVNLEFSRCRFLAVPFIASAARAVELPEKGAPCDPSGCYYSFTCLPNRNALFARFHAFLAGMVMYASVLCVRAGSAYQASFEVVRQVRALAISVDGLN